MNESRMAKATALVAILACGGSPTARTLSDLSWIRVSDDKSNFVYESSGKIFRPWGFNYDRDSRGRLIEDYWESEWEAVEKHFAQMKALGANVVRVHLQFGRFMAGPRQPNEAALARLARLVELAERERLYLDITGLGCYHKKDVPAWYDKLAEEDRWAAQANFWRAIAERVKSSPAVFCYDLMNEPVVPGGRRADGDWLGPPLGNKYYVQCISLDQKDRPRPEIARKWIKQLAGTIRQVDRRHLITVGLVDWSLDQPGLSSGFVPSKIADDVDFLCVHLYPQTGKLSEAHKTLKGFAVGRPVVVEETFPLACSTQELGRFIDDSKADAAGWISFYWGKPPDDLQKSKDVGDAILFDWLKEFSRRAPASK